MTKTPVLVTFALLAAAHPSWSVAQPEEFNYDESKVPKYTLPDPLVLASGERVTSQQQWRSQRRPEILKQFEEQVYGRSPAPLPGMRFHVRSVKPRALDGKAVRKQVTVYFSGDKNGPQMDILIYLPGQVTGPVPVFVGLNFYGNHTIHRDPAIKLSNSWMRNNKEYGVVENRASEAARGTAARRWAVDRILARGYALATIYYGDIDPDYDDEFQNGVHPLFYETGQTKPKADEWGSISAWAWGLSRALDYFETDGDIDHDHVAVMGHSRLGKTALWAGALDERFSMVISNDSGCGGAALSRRRFGETVKRINTSFPHWFCDNFVTYNDDEASLPVDQHMLVALIAPRPVYIASAQQDKWADPRGEFLSGYHADAVYRLHGVIGMDTDRMPKIDEPVMQTIGYHVRTGKHDVTDFDWKCYLDFADKHFPHRSR